MELFVFAGMVSYRAFDVDEFYAGSLGRLFGTRGAMRRARACLVLCGCANFFVEASGFYFYGQTCDPLPLTLIFIQISNRK